ncbi:iron ABC transporter permease [Catenovulum sp. SM1970]|nr:iron ABC transporter permease [Marinifaba aquimaris]
MPLKWILLIFTTLISMALSLGLGSSQIGFNDVWQCLFSECQSPIKHAVIHEIRLPRILVGFIAGAGLAVAGSLLQNTTRNPLADPYLFGIVSGAGLGATLGSVLFADANLGLPFMAFMGAAFSIVLVLAVVSSSRQRKLEHMLLAGVAVSFMLSAMTSFTLYFGDAFATNRVIFWLMGSLARAEYQALYFMAPVLIIALVLAMAFARQLDALLLSDENAKTLGIKVEWLRIGVLIICAALTAVIVAYCGGIGFVGLMIPHMIRPFFGVTTTKLLFAVALSGGIFLVWVDVVARTALGSQEIPLGVITSAIGSIFFLILMRRMR